MLYQCFTICIETHLVFCHYLLVLSLQNRKLLLPLCHAIRYCLVHFGSLKSNLLVDFVKSEAGVVNFYRLFLSERHTVDQGGLVQDSERDVTNLLHSEHARLLESL